MEDSSLTIINVFYFFISFITFTIGIVICYNFYICLAFFGSLIFIGIKFKCTPLSVMGIFDLIWLLGLTGIAVESSRLPLLQSINRFYNQSHKDLIERIKLYLPIRSESQACWQAYLLIKRELNEFDSVYPLIDSVVRNLIQDVSGIERIINEKHCSYNVLGYYLIFLASKKILLIGDVYYYRGQLTSTGIMIKRLFDLSLQILEKNSFMTKEDIDEERNYIKSEIAANG